MKNFYLILLAFGLISCKNSAESTITGIWDSYWQDDDTSISYRILFSDDGSFKQNGEIVTINGRYNCEFYSFGYFNITENDIISFNHTDIKVYDCNSTYFENQSKARIEKTRHITESFKILSLDSETIITEDMDTYKRRTYMRNKKLEKKQDRGMTYWFKKTWRQIQWSLKKKSDGKKGDHYGKKRNM